MTGGVDEVLARGALNRALLARQMLLERVDVPIGEAVEHLVGLQAQAPMPPYYGLWSRLESFDPHPLGRMLTEREVVRLTLMRGTIHLVTVRDAGFLRSLLHAAIERKTTQAARHMGDVGPQRLTEVVRELLADGPLTAREIARGLAERGIGGDAVAHEAAHMARVRRTGRVNARHPLRSRGRIARLPATSQGPEPGSRCSHAHASVAPKCSMLPGAHSSGMFATHSSRLS